MRPSSFYCKLFFVLCIAAAQAFSHVIHYNQIGYEVAGPKVFIVEDSASIPDTAFSIMNKNGVAVYTGVLGKNQTVGGWKGRYFRTGDFSTLIIPGVYTIVCNTAKTAEFEVSKNVLFSRTAQAAADFFFGMRNKNDDTKVPFFGQTGVTKDVHGGWNDATGDMGKYLSHLSYANYMNPQQTPMVVWSLLQSHELNPKEFSSSLLAEAAYGADYLVRSLDDTGYFYMIVFDRWGWDAKREICTWKYNPDPSIPSFEWNGYKTKNRHAGIREGGGMAVAALAKAAGSGISADFGTNQYLAAAEKGYLHLKQHNKEYLDNGAENIIDDYCGLMAATELYKVTLENAYKTDAGIRADSLIKRMNAAGWFRSDGKNQRPFYHAAEEGLPLVALVNYLAIDSSKKSSIFPVLRKSLDWYLSISQAGENPFNYMKEYYAVFGLSGGGNYALKKTATASSSQASNTPEKAFDGDKANSRWSSAEPFNADPYEHWIYVDLGQVFDIEKVVLRWEAAYGTDYYIYVSDDAVQWKCAYHQTAGDGGVDEIILSPVQKGRFVKMQGMKKALQWGGYSLYEFEVYGQYNGPVTCSTSFFQQHNNETGYWWQGENARIASLAAAFIVSASTIDPDFRISTRDSISSIAIAQLDWILGKNPFDVCMMYGFGRKNYPDYPGKDGYAIKNVRGGICNGITSDSATGTDICWMPYSADNFENWRWIEQWLPHNAWYLFAVSAFNNILNKPITPITYSGKNQSPCPVRIAFRDERSRGAHIVITGVPLRSNAALSVYSVAGRRVMHTPVKQRQEVVPLTTLARGVYVVRYDDNIGNSVKATFFMMR